MLASSQLCQSTMHQSGRSVHWLRAAREPELRNFWNLAVNQTAPMRQQYLYSEPGTSILESGVR